MACEISKWVCGIFLYRNFTLYRSFTLYMSVHCIEVVLEISHVFTFYGVVHYIGVYTSYLVDVYPVLLVPDGRSGIDVAVHCIGDCYQEVSIKIK